jgi:hypothetical protein
VLCVKKLMRTCLLVWCSCDADSWLLQLHVGFDCLLNTVTHNLLVCCLRNVQAATSKAVAWPLHRLAAAKQQSCISLR